MLFSQYNKNLYRESKSTKLWDEIIPNGLLHSDFVVIKVYPYLFMYNTVACVEHVDYCFFGHACNMILIKY